MTPGEAMFLAGAVVGFLATILMGLIALAVFEWRHALMESRRWDAELARAAKRGAP